MNLCTSARESWITRLWEKLNKIHVWINCVRSSECRTWRFLGSNFQKFFGGSMLPDPPPPCITHAFGADSLLVSTVIWYLMQLQKNSIPGQNEWWYRVWIKQKFEHQRNTTKRDEVATEKIIKSIGVEKSSWIMNPEENCCRNHESLRPKRQESWISRLKWFRFYPRV